MTKTKAMATQKTYTIRLYKKALLPNAQSISGYHGL